MVEREEKNPFLLIFYAGLEVVKTKAKDLSLLISSASSSVEVNNCFLRKRTMLRQ